MMRLIAALPLRMAWMVITRSQKLLVARSLAAHCLALEAVELKPLLPRTAATCTNG
jgi:hypothetical protein